MIYAYDILVNLNEDLIDFYDWKSTDELTHIRRVPLFKVNDKTYFDLLYKRVRIDEDVMLIIKEKTQVFTSKSLETITYAASFTNGLNACLITFDSKGFTHKKSKYLVNEELEITELACKMRETIINYNIINNTIHSNNMTRYERSKLKIILEELDKIKDDNKKIDYLYYEWFGKEESNNKYIELIKSLKEAYTPKHNEFLEILNLLTLQK